MLGMPCSMRRLYIGLSTSGCTSTTMVSVQKGPADAAMAIPYPIQSVLNRCSRGVTLQKVQIQVRNAGLQRSYGGGLVLTVGIRTFTLTPSGSWLLGMPNSIRRYG